MLRLSTSDKSLTHLMPVSICSTHTINSSMLQLPMLWWFLSWKARSASARVGKETVASPVGCPLTLRCSWMHSGVSDVMCVRMAGVQIVDAPQRSGSRVMRGGSGPMLVWWWLDGCSSTWRWKWWQSSSVVRRRAHWWRWIWPVEDRGKRSCKCVAWWSERCGWNQLCWTGWTKWRKRRSWGKMRWRQHCTTRR